MAYEIRVNGETKSVDLPPDVPLLWALRDGLGMTGRDVFPQCLSLPAASIAGKRAVLAIGVGSHPRP